MFSYLIRVELFGNASWLVYQQLHEKLERLGYKRTIVSSDGLIYDLPTATYYKHCPLALAQIVSEAKLAASTVWADSSVLVSEGNNIRWQGLKQHSNRFSA